MSDRKDNIHVSVVMPTYNASEFVKESVMAILAQTFTDFELVIVDDCSTDNTYSIIEELAKNDSRIHPFRLDKNSGSAKYPREIAVKNATADFICWIDSDDIIPKDYLAKLVNARQQTDADIVCSKMVAFLPDKTVKYTLPRRGFDYTQIYTGRQAFNMALGTKWDISVNGCMIRSSIWRGTSTFLDPTLNGMNFDDFSSREMLLMARAVKIVDVPYYYRLHDKAITKAISHKLFETLDTDEHTLRFVSNRFGVRSEEYKSALDDYVHNYTSRLMLWGRYGHTLTSTSAQKAKNLLWHHKKGMTIKAIHQSSLPIRQKILLLLPLIPLLKIVRLLNR